MKVAVFCRAKQGVICEHLYAAYLYLAVVRVNHLARLA
jgi:hypothetical protein